jgi:polysaccharide export outer membrane protein
VPAPREATGGAADSYKLDAGDRVRVVVAGKDDLSGSYEVKAGGAIEIPSLGMVSARGLSTVQLSGAIARRLKQNKVRDAHVAVQVETFRPFTIRGGVANPGQYPYVNNMTAETAIAIAGGLKAGADKSAVTITGSVQGGAARGPASLNSPIQPGDTVTVPEER